MPGVTCITELQSTFYTWTQAVISQQKESLCRRLSFGSKALRPQKNKSFCSMYYQCVYIHLSTKPRLTTFICRKQNFSNNTFSAGTL